MTRMLLLAAALVLIGAGCTNVATSSKQLENMRIQAESCEKVNMSVKLWDSGYIQCDGSTL